MRSHSPGQHSGLRGALDRALERLSLETDVGKIIPQPSLLKPFAPAPRFKNRKRVSHYGTHLAFSRRDCSIVCENMFHIAEIGI
jgi:hypothetical protein